MTTYSAAIDSMYGTFKTAWDNGASPIIGYVPDVEYDEPDEEDRAPLDKAFARLAVRNLNEGLLAMGNCEGNTKLWFKNATIREQTPGKRWRQFNVNVEYDFTETT
jgi:hypothetical protein